MSTVLKPIQLLEINVISAQDLARVSRGMKTYAIAWVNPERKLSTRVDTNGAENPTWNDKFVFRVDDRFLRGDTSAVMVEIYAQSWFRDILVGSVRVIVGNLIPPQNVLSHNNHIHLGMRFVALQVRRPSGRPQGILNIGATLLDSSRRSMPLYNQFASSAVGYKQLMGGEESSDSNSNNESEKNGSVVLVPWVPKPELRRIKSESSSLVGSSIMALEKGKLKKTKGGSIVNVSEVERKRFDNKTNKMSKSKSSSVISFSPESSDYGGLVKAKYKSLEEANLNVERGGKLTTMNHPAGQAPIDFDPGPSASEVAAALFYKRQNNKMIEDNESKIVGEWDLESKEGLRSKLARWREEGPPVYETRRQLKDFMSSISSSEGRGSAIHTPRRRRNTNKSRSYGYSYSDEEDDYEDDVDGGGFSCFSKICGLECSIACGGGSSRRRSAGRGRRVTRSPSIDSSSYLS